MRHSLAHITAQAVQHMWPDAKFGVGPVVENGFYYDIDLGETKLSEADFKKIEKEMRSIINKDYPFERSTKGIDEAINWAKEHNQPYKVELLNDLQARRHNPCERARRKCHGYGITGGNRWGGAGRRTECR